MGHKNGNFQVYCKNIPCNSMIEKGFLTSVFSINESSLQPTYHALIENYYPSSRQALADVRLPLFNLPTITVIHVKRDIRNIRRNRWIVYYRQIIILTIEGVINKVPVSI